jgi:hypothetical protein
MNRSLVVLITLLWIALAVLALGHTTAETLQFLDDQAFLMGTADAVKRGELLLSGLPSHLGARHLGPYYVYLQAGLSWLGDSDPVVVSLLFTVLKLFTPIVIVAALVLTIGVARGGYIAGLCVMLASLSGYTIALLRMDWINYFLVLVSSLLTLAIVRVVTKGASALPLLILASTLVIQPHLSPLPILGAAWGGIVLYLVLCSRLRSADTIAERRPSTGTMLCIIVTAVLWLPAFVYEVIYERNLFAILGHNVGKRPEGAGFSEIPTVFFEFISEVITGGRGSLPLVWISIWSALCLLLLARKALLGGRTERACIGIALLQCCAMFVALTQVKPPVHHYYLISLYAPLLYLWGLAAHEAFKVLRQHSYTASAVAQKAIAVAVLGLFAYVWSDHLTELPRSAWKPLSQSYFSLAHARDVAKIIHDDSGGSKQVKIVTRGGARLSANAYYYQISPLLLREFMYAPRMIELPVINRGPLSFDRGYLVTCGADALSDIPTLGRRLKDQWSIGEEVSLATCESCAQCRMWRLVPDANG